MAGDSAPASCAPSPANRSIPPWSNSPWRTAPTKSNPVWAGFRTAAFAQRKWLRGNLPAVIICSRGAPTKSARDGGYLFDGCLARKCRDVEAGARRNQLKPIGKIARERIRHNRVSLLIHHVRSADVPNESTFLNESRERDLRQCGRVPIGNELGLMHG